MSNKTPDRKIEPRTIQRPMLLNNEKLNVKSELRIGQCQIFSTPCHIHDHLGKFVKYLILIIYYDIMYHVLYVIFMITVLLQICKIKIKIFDHMCVVSVTLPPCRI
jgi:hypothetical protein